VPGYTSVLQKKIEGSTSIRKQLNALKGHQGSKPSRVARVVSVLLARLGVVWSRAQLHRRHHVAEHVTGQGAHDEGLRGKVVIVDFWTYSCINCQRSLPHVEAWYKRYAPYGLEIVACIRPSSLSSTS